VEDREAQPVPLVLEPIDREGQAVWLFSFFGGAPAAVPLSAPLLAPLPASAASADQVRCCFAQLLSDLGDEDARIIMATMVKSVARDISACVKALEGGDRRALEGAAHSLKGSSGTFGLDTIMHLCLELEETGPDRAAGLVARLQAEVAAFNVAATGLLSDQSQASLDKKMAVE
jgi:HPt (histidine-containing phosphotransfer) domain-containing protein